VVNVKTAPVKIVARYLDGRVIKGTSMNFSPTRGTFLLQQVEAPSDEEPLTIALRDLKAVFFVRDFAGNPRYDDRKEFERRPVGRAIAVTFLDGELIVGSSLTYDAARDGFFLFPADPSSNNERIYVLTAAVRKVEKLR
jgi:hypothetical protein